MKSPHPTIQEALIGHNFPGLKKPAPSPQDEIISLRADNKALKTDLRRAEEQISALRAEKASLRAQNLELDERLRQRPELREIVGELRELRDLLLRGNWNQSAARLTVLLRRLDESEAT